MRTTCLCFCVVFTLLVAGCRNGNPVSEFQSPSELPAGIWQLEAFVRDARLRDVLGETELTLEFRVGEEINMGGRAGCNFYGGAVSWENGRLVVGPIGQTQMLCLKPKGVMEQEETYLSVLRSAVELRVGGDQLVLFDADRKPVLVFSRP